VRTFAREVRHLNSPSVGHSSYFVAGMASAQARFGLVSSLFLLSVDDYSDVLRTIERDLRFAVRRDNSEVNGLSECISDTSR